MANETKDQLDQNETNNSKKANKKTKRGQGEGTIYKRKDGRWAAAINLGYQNGKLKRKTFYGGTREQVKNKLVAALSDQQKGLPVLTERQTLAQFLEKWLADVAQPSIRPKTYRFYSDHIRLHIIPALGKKRLENLRLLMFNILRTTSLKLDCHRNLLGTSLQLCVRVLVSQSNGGLFTAMLLR